MQPWQPQQPPQHPIYREPDPPPLPGAIAPMSADDQDIRSLTPFLPKVAASLVAVAGLCALLGSFQTWMMVTVVDDLWAIVPVLNALLGVASIVVATRLAVARRWASIAALVLSSLLFVSTTAWGIYAFTNQLFATFILIAPLMAVAGTGLAAASIMPCDRAERARLRLATQGLELGL